ncbi:hypothetical protein LV35_04201 [Acinetobacter baumannii]|uniref:Uncharacterized protein n=1 Tax=Acinetobacter baumannii TaxID=470 RepID=A0AAJ0VL72_ACIBA|nr:hypothetical protein LV35_04201 [Acinetobacter baumannii]
MAAGGNSPDREEVSPAVSVNVRDNPIPGVVDIFERSGPLVLGRGAVVDGDADPALLHKVGHDGVALAAPIPDGPGPAGNEHEDRCIHRIEGKPDVELLAGAVVADGFGEELPPRIEMRKCGDHLAPRLLPVTGGGFERLARYEVGNHQLEDGVGVRATKESERLTRREPQRHPGRIRCLHRAVGGGHIDPVPRNPVITGQVAGPAREAPDSALGVRKNGLIVRLGVIEDELHDLVEKSCVPHVLSYPLVTQVDPSGVKSMEVAPPLVQVGQVQEPR